MLYLEILGKLGTLAFLRDCPDSETDKVCELYEQTSEANDWVWYWLRPEWKVPGRPRVREDLKKSETIQVRLSYDEKESVREAANRCDLNLSEWTLRIILYAATGKEDTLTKRLKLDMEFDEVIRRIVNFKKPKGGWPKQRPALSRRLRFEVLKRDDFTCQYCGKSAPDTGLHIDHIVPVSKGGGSEKANLMTACIDCNIGKGPRPL